MVFLDPDLSPCLVFTPLVFAVCWSRFRRPCLDLSPPCCKPIRTIEAAIKMNINIQEFQFEPSEIQFQWMKINSINEVWGGTELIRAQTKKHSTNESWSGRCRLCFLSKCSDVEFWTGSQALHFWERHLLHRGWNSPKLQIWLCVASPATPGLHTRGHFRETLLTRRLSAHAGL